MKELSPKDIKTKEDFKYPTVKLFFDADRVACAFLHEIIEIYPEFEEKFRDKCWGIHDKNEDYQAVIAVSDVQTIVELDYLKENELIN